MRAEKYEGINNILVIDDSEKKAMISKEKDLSEKNKLNNQLQAVGKDTNQAREELITRSLTDKLEYKPEKLKEYFRNQHMSDEAKMVDVLKSNKPSQNFKQISNEIKFFGQSFAEGFLSFYGMELDNAVKDYEQRLHIIEQVELNNNHKEYYLGTIKDNDLKLVNENTPFASKAEAEQILERVNNPKQNQQENLSETLQRRKSQENEN